jgi:antirestriction protein ArdC
MRTDIYERITNLIVADLEKGERPWHKPWKVRSPAGGIRRPLRANGEPYRGINVLMLWDAASRAGFHAETWMTYNQASELGGQVRKGEKASTVVYANKISRSEKDSETGEEGVRQIPYMKAYSVFNSDQIDGLPGGIQSLPSVTEAFERINYVEDFFKATGANIRHGGENAYYSLSDDRVQMPPFEAFRDP